jgi:hypothetical protein
VAIESVDPAQDQQWHEEIVLTLIPNPKLNEKALVEKDFGMPDGRLQIPKKPWLTIPCSDISDHAG